MQCIIHTSLSLCCYAVIHRFKSVQSQRCRMTPRATSWPQRELYRSSSGSKSTRSTRILQGTRKWSSASQPNLHSLRYARVDSLQDLHVNTFGIILHIRIVCVHLLHELLLCTYFYYSGRPLMIPCPLYCRCPRGLLMPGGGWRRQHRTRRRWRKRMALMINWRQ